MQLHATVPGTMNWIGREGTTLTGEPLAFPVPMLQINYGVFATPGSILREVDGHPVLGFLLDYWVLVDMRSGREIPMAYEGTDVAEAMRRFAEEYHHEGRRLYGADLALFCESWRERNGVGRVPLGHG